MIEFRLHEGKTQFRTWNILFDNTGELHMYLDSDDSDVWGRIFGGGMEPGVAEKLADRINKVAVTPLEYHKDCFSMVIPMPGEEEEEEELREYCGICRCFDAAEEKKGPTSVRGYCRLYPARIEKMGFEWCGQWRAKNA